MQRGVAYHLSFYTCKRLFFADNGVFKVSNGNIEAKKSPVLEAHNTE